MQGLHLTADLHGCRCEPAWLTDAARLGAACRQAVAEAGLQGVAELLHAFPAGAHGPGGVTAAVLLAESHLCVHTWPELGAATLDVYVCNYGGDHSAKAEALMARLLALFDAEHAERHALRRGALREGRHVNVAAMILAAGRGERMRPLTDTVPKPMLAVQDKPLLQWHLEALERGGFHDVVINTAWLGEQIQARFGPRWPGGDVRPLAIRYSHEGLDFGGALETAGGISRALPLLGDVFWVLAGDVFAPDFAFSKDAAEEFAASGKLAHLWLVPNPAHNPGGDFGLQAGLALNRAPDKYTYSTIGLYRAALFAPPWCDIPAGNPQGRKAPLAPLLRAAMDNGLVSAELYEGAWTDVGTPGRLAQLNAAPDNT